MAEQVDKWQPLQWFNRVTTARHLQKARWLAIAHPMGIGDVVAVLPLAGIIKKNWPRLNICFIGSAYVRPLIECCEHIDHFMEFNALILEPQLISRQGIDIFLNPFPHRELAAAAHKAGVPVRVGNLRRWKVVPHCNCFVIYSRRYSGRHEIELNLENLAGIGLPTHYPLSDIPDYFGLTRLPELAPQFAREIDGNRFNVIFHPKSNKNGREWPARHYAALAQMLPSERFHILVTGSADEGEALRNEAPELLDASNVSNLCGRLSLEQLIALISCVDGLIGSGSGPLHLAAALNKHALGIFPPRDDIDPAHWAPIGKKGEYLCLPDRCWPGEHRCPDKFSGEYCACTAAIIPEQVKARVMTWSGSSLTGI